jgi:hypothetical protein
MSYRTNRLGEQVSDSYESVNEEYSIDVDCDFPSFLENDDEQLHEDETEGKEEATTPILRPWTNTNFRKVATATTSVPTKSYDPSQYHSRSGSDLSRSSLDKSQSPPHSLSSEDQDDESPSLQPTEPMTPSRLLTLNSLDFLDVNVEMSPKSSSRGSHSNDSLGHSKESRSHSDDIRGYSRESRSHSTQDIGQAKIQHSPIMSPITPEDVTDDDLKGEISVHGNIVSEYATQLTLSLQNHLSEVMLNLTRQKETELRGRDTFYTKELQKQQIIIEDLEEVVSIYEKNILSEEAQVEKYRALVSSVCWQQRQQYVSPFSLSRLLQHWRVFTNSARRMTKLYKLASRHRRKSVLRVVFDEFKREADFMHAERKGVEEKKHFDRTVRDLVSRYEKQISELKGDLKESQEALGQEKSRRQQLEEDLRRMFLKNMTVMNMEALSLFQTPVVAPPQLAEFGPERKLAGERHREECTRLEREGRLSHMRQQQQQLQTHQFENTTAADQRARASHIPTQQQQQQMKRTALMEQKHSRHPKHHSVEREVTAVHRSSVDRSSGERSSVQRRSVQEWEDEEQFPRVTPHPLPYSNFMK